MLYDRILAAVAGTPWAIEPAKGQVVADVLNRRLRGDLPPAAQVEDWHRREMARRDEQRTRRKREQPAVALVPLYGVMTQRADWFTEMSGMSSTETVGRAIDEAVADPSVEAIVLDIDSPGGSVYGVQELADKVAAATTTKKVIAVANSTAASGAYYVASQASEFVVTPSGDVGSIGVFVMHVDRSEEMKASGRTVSFVSAGDLKTAVTPYKPLDATAQAYLQEYVRGTYDQFVRAVAKGRNVSQAKVREGFGKGGMVLAHDAVKEGMADKVQSLEQVLARYGVRVADVLPTAQASDVERFGLEIRKRKLKIS